MVGWHHRLDGHGFGWTLGVGDGQGGLVCCGSWGHKESDMTEWLNWNLLHRESLYFSSYFWLCFKMFLIMKRGGHGLATEQQVMKNLSSLIWPGQHGVVYVLLIPDKVILKWKVKGKVGKSCPTLWDPTDYRVHGILQARILEWVAFPFSRSSPHPRDWTQVSFIADGFFRLLYLSTNSEDTKDLW